MKMEQIVSSELYFVQFLVNAGKLARYVIYQNC